jgi:hypothetical protein
MKPCAACQQFACEERIHFGDLPICHHLLAPGEQEETHPAALGQCKSCGLVQMMDPISPAKLVPRFDWISYNEPEAHLDAVVEMLCGLPGIAPGAAIAGLSRNDDSTLKRFQQRGFVSTWRADMRTDLEIDHPNAGIETVQSRIKPPLAERLRQTYGAPDLLIVRMMLEHSGEAVALLATVRSLLSPSGSAVFEVPDCSRAFDLLDYTTVWEDHALYFVENTFLAALRLNGFAIERFECYPGRYENCLVAVAKPAPDAAENQRSPRSVEPPSEREDFARFASGFEGRRTAVRNELERWRKLGRVALFGAGHQSAMYINLLGVGDLVDFVLDDHPHKCGRRMPGSHVPILNSNSLYSEGVKLCLSSLGADSEPKVLKKHERFIREGGVFASIFPVNRSSVFNFLAGDHSPSEPQPLAA